MKRLEGKIAIVTGAGSGIGRAIVELYVSEGARVLGADIANYDSLTQEFGEAAAGIRCDVRSEADVAALFAKCQQIFGQPDILCNNAGIGIGGKRLHEVAMEDFDKVLDITVRGAFIVLQQGLRAMLAKGGGSIINTASIGAYKPAPLTGAYCPSKAAILQMSRVAALEYAADNIRVNAICPGTTRTAILNNASQEVLDGVKRIVPMGRLGTAREIANAALYLGSDESSFVTGEAMIIDGGKMIG